MYEEFLDLLFCMVKDLEKALRVPMKSKDPIAAMIARECRIYTAQRCAFLLKDFLLEIYKDSVEGRGLPDSKEFLEGAPPIEMEKHDEVLAMLHLFGFISVKDADTLMEYILDSQGYQIPLELADCCGDEKNEEEGESLKEMIKEGREDYFNGISGFYYAVNRFLTTSHKIFSKR